MDQPVQKAATVLVVDDEPLMRESLARLLVSDGHSVRTADNGREGLLLFEKGRFDLVILDYEMPDVKGDELALMVKALAPDQPLMMISASPETLRTNLLTDVDLVIGKPFAPREFLAAARRLLGKQ
jgi:two-component system cell cycle sensor histidine kinase/response regulator CckA